MKVKYPSFERLQVLTYETADPLVWPPSKLQRITGSSLVSSIQPIPPFLNPYPITGQYLCVCSVANEIAVHAESSFCIYNNLSSFRILIALS